MAQYDALTHLPNRALFNDRLHQAIAAAQRNKAHLALMFIDLDKFKPVNDTYGHGVGDLLLKEVALRIQDCLRESDTAARIGGDEFVILLPAIETQQDASKVGEKIRLALNQPFELAGHTLKIGSSIGVAVYPQHGSDEKLLVKSADIAMYHAKQNGRNNVKIYQLGMQEISQ
jgi:diguanylate cyclase (GGDEF)-like protein